MPLFHMLDELAAPSKVKPCLRDIGADRIVMNYMESRYYTIAPRQLAAVDSQHLAALVFEKARAMAFRTTYVKHRPYAEPLKGPAPQSGIPCGWIPVVDPKT